MNSKPKLTVHPQAQGRTLIAIASACRKVGCDYVISREPSVEPDRIPMGSVEYCAPSFGKHKGDSYPEFLQKFISRDIRRVNGPHTLQSEAFVKQADVWKSDFESGVYSAGTELGDADWLISDVVEFINEWRYYVADGKIYAAEWYRGVNSDEDAPVIDIEWPEGFSGAVDFGIILPDARVELVECHAPFACGWYGDDHEVFLKWQIDAWNNRGWWCEQ
jgi:hypothetical protein